MPVQTTPAIVIRAQALGEHDKLVSFLTLTGGKVKAIARGARRPRNRLAGSLDLLNHGELVYFERPHKELQYVNTFDVTQSFRQIKEDLTTTAYGFYVVELIDQFAQERESDPRIFELLLQMLHALQDHSSPEMWVHAFEIRLLSLSGFRPYLERCILCGGALETQPVLFHVSRGGCVCAICTSSAPPLQLRETPQSVSVPPAGIYPLPTPGALKEARPRQSTPYLKLSRGSWRVLLDLQQRPWHQLQRIRLSEQNARELTHLLTTLITYQLDRPLKSLEFIQNVRLGCL